jgi:hypothetical protein
MSAVIIGGKTYETADLRLLKVRDQVRLERWLARVDLTDARSFEDIIQIAVEISLLPDVNAQRRHPDFKLFVMIGVWAARIQAGEDASLDDCGAYTWDDLTFVVDPAGGESEGKGLAAS